MMDPAIVLVHGSWHVPKHYELLISALNSQGFKHVYCPRLPSAVDRLPLPSTANLAHDTLTIRNQIASLAEAGHPIIVVMHSYGGVVGGNALTEDLPWSRRRDTGKPGGVIHIVYTAAFIIPAGTSLSTPFKDELAPWLEEDTENGIINILEPQKSNYSDIKDDAEARKWLDLCCLCPASVVKDKVERDPCGFVVDGSLGATYLVCKEDYRLTMEGQEGMATLLGEEREVVYCDAGHCPMVSCPEKVAGVVREAWIKSEKRYELSG